MTASTLDRTWTEDPAGIRLETHSGEFLIDTVRDRAREVVLVRGELDMATAPLLRAVLETIGARRPRRIEIDVRGVDFLDLYGAVCLAEGCRFLSASGAEPMLREVSPAVRRLLTLTGFDRTLPICESGPAVPGQVGDGAYGGDQPAR